MRPRPQGLSIAVVLLVLALMSVIGLGVSALGVQNLNHAAAYRDGAAALKAAEAGVAVVLLELKQDRSWEAGCPSTELPGESAAYAVSITNNMTGNSSLPGPDGLTVPARSALVVANGTRGRMRRRVGVMVYNVTTVFNQALLGSTLVTMSGGASTDGFDSSAGTYQETREDTGGDVVTNGTVAGAVTIAGASTQVGGSVVVGAGGDPEEVIVAPDGAFQTSLAMKEPIALPPVEVPAGVSQGDRSFKTSTGLAPGIYGDVNLSAGAQVTLSSGEYVLRSLTLLGGGSLLVDASAGPVVVIIAGDGNDATLDLDLSGGGAVNPTHQSGLLLLLMGPQATSAKVTGGSDAFLGLYGPAATVVVTGGADIYGSIAADRVNFIGGGALHYDLGLRTTTVGPSYLEVRSWQRF